MDGLNSGHAAALWCGLNLILLLVLSILVVRQRQKHHIVTGDGDIAELAQAIRAFGNASEYIPAGIAALAVMASSSAPSLAIHVTGAVLFLGRGIHAVGLSLGLGASLPRTMT